MSRAEISSSSSNMLRKRETRQVPLVRSLGEKKNKKTGHYSPPDGSSPSSLYGPCNMPFCYEFACKSILISSLSRTLTHSSLWYYQRNRNSPAYLLVRPLPIVRALVHLLLL